MRPDDETIYQASGMQDGFENEEKNEEAVNAAESQQTAPKSGNKGNGWAKFAIGGVTGVLMGTVGMYAGKPFLDDAVFGEGNSLADWLEDQGIDTPDWLRHGSKAESQVAEADPQPVAEPTPETPVEPKPHTAHAHTAQAPQSEPIPPIGGPLLVAHVDESLPFDEAFAQAREEVGPGGVFHWRGGVFGTYTEAEWNSMSAAEKSDYAQHVAPEVHHHDAGHNDMAHNQGPKATEDTGGEEIIEVVPSDDDDTTIEIHDNDGSEPNIVVEGTEPEPDVHFLGVEQVETEDGSTMNVGYARIDNEDVAFVDVDNDMVFDVRMHDDNHNGKIDEEEVVPLADGNLTVEEFADLAIMQGHSEVGSLMADNTQISQDDLAQGMPDYQNDADVSDLFTA